MLSTLFLSLAITVPLPELPNPDLTIEQVENIITKELLSQGYINTVGVAWYEQDWQGQWRCHVGFEQDGAFRTMHFTGETFRECVRQFYDLYLQEKL